LKSLFDDSFRLSERIVGISKVIGQADLVNFQVIAVEERSLFGGSSIHDDGINLVIDQVDTLLTLRVQFIVSGICPDFEVSICGVQRIEDVIASVVIVTQSARNERIFLHFWDLESKLVVGVDLIHLESILLSSLEGAFSKVECELIIPMRIKSNVIFVSRPVIAISVYVRIKNTIVSSIEFLKHPIEADVSGNVFEVLLIFSHIEEGALEVILDEV
jgi:hypothetical protein